MSISLRPACPSDAAAVAELEKACFFDPWKEGDVAALLADATSFSFLCTEDDRPIGYMTGRLIAGEGEIYRIAVSPSERRRGIGRRLLDLAKTHGTARGMTALFLEVRSRNTPAKELYLAFGFSEIGRRKNYYRDPPDDAVTMRLDTDGAKNEHKE